MKYRLLRRSRRQVGMEVGEVTGTVAARRKALAGVSMGQSLADSWASRGKTQYGAFIHSALPLPNSGLIGFRRADTSSKRVRKCSPYWWSQWPSTRGFGCCSWDSSKLWQGRRCWWVLPTLRRMLHRPPGSVSRCRSARRKPECHFP